MPEYKLSYFDGRGLAELSRWIMHYANIPFTDERVTQEDWPEKKKTIPGGKMPVLDVDGKVLPQSLAIARFLAVKGGLVPEDPLHAAFCDATAETFKEMIIDLFKINTAEGKSEEEKKKTLNEEYLPNTLMPILERINKRLDGREWLIGDKVTWADIAIARSMSEFFPLLPDLASKVPNVKAHCEKIKNLPGIKEWLQRRPETSF